MLCNERSKHLRAELAEQHRSSRAQWIVALVFCAFGAGTFGLVHDHASADEVSEDERRCVVCHLHQHTTALPASAALGAQAEISRGDARPVEPELASSLAVLLSPLRRGPPAG